MGYIDVTDATFETDVIARSMTTPVVVDLWAPWCGPCRTLGPIIEKVVDDTNGDVVLVKVNVDENPQISQAFQVQSIPAVYAMAEGRVVDGFIGAQGEPAVQAFVDRIRPSEETYAIAALLAAGDEASLQQVLDLDPGNPDAVIMLAELWVGEDRGADALALLERIPEDAEVRRVKALARTGNAVVDDGVQDRLDALLDQVKVSDEARQEFIDLLEIMGADDPRTVTYRKKLTARLY